MSVPITWVNLGHMHYDEALDAQMSSANKLLALQSEAQTVFAVEHPPTITIGRNGTEQNIMADETFLEQQGFVVRHVDRGGDVTYHGPGQLVVYPVLHLQPWQNDVKSYVRMLEEVVIQALKPYGIVGNRDDAYPGVWVNDAKICAVGARVKKRSTGEFITYHGIALNLNTDLTHFQTIVPCGIQDRDVTSVARELGHAVDFNEWQEHVKSSFLNVFSAHILAESAS